MLKHFLVLTPPATTHQPAPTTPTTVTTYHPPPTTHQCVRLSASQALICALSMTMCLSMFCILSFIACRHAHTHTTEREGGGGEEMNHNYWSTYFWWTLLQYLYVYICNGHVTYRNVGATYYPNSSSALSAQFRLFLTVLSCSFLFSRDRRSSA